MTDHEFVIEIRRGMMIILRACIERFSLSWDWFQPRENVYSVSPLESGRTTSTLQAIDKTKKTIV